MLNAFIGNIKNRRLVRLQYFTYSFLLALFVLIFMLSAVMAIGAGEHILGGDIQAAQAQLREWFTLPFMIILGIFMGLITFMSLNIMAKRIRDIGLSGWLLVVVIVVFEAIISSYVSQQASGGFHAFIWLLLVLIPSNFFANKQS